MLRRLITNTVFMRCTIFASVFVLTCTIIGVQSVEFDPSADIAHRPLSSEAVEGPEAAAIHASTATALSARELGSDQFQAGGSLVGDELLLATLAPIDMVAQHLPGKAGFVFLESIPMNRELQLYTWQRCQDTGLEYELVLAIMWRESRFQTDAVNLNTDGTQDSGLMQINDINRGWLSQDYGIEDLMDPYQNIDAGIAILAMYMDKYPENQALLAYQYGEGGMLERRAQGMITSDLTVLVQNKRDEFRALVQAEL